MNLAKQVATICLVCVLFFSLTAYASAHIESSHRPRSFSGIAKKNAKGAVVNISTFNKVETSRKLRKYFSPFQNHPFFEEFFEEFLEKLPRKQKKHALGSGFIISENGYIVTNHHVVAKADKIKVSLLNSDKTHKAKIVGTDKGTDLALLKMNMERDLPTLEFGDSNELKPGQWVVAIGNPFGLSHTVTAGIVSAKDRVIGAGPYDHFIQTDASINPGNSGGPLLNLQGKVVGINTAIVAQGQGIGFAVPSDMARNVISQLKKYHTVKRGWLGVTIQDVDRDIANALDLPETQGALVASVKEGDPAEKAGIRAGDVILQVNGEAVESAHELTRSIGLMTPGETARIVLLRDGEKMEVSVELGRRNKHLASQHDEDSAEAGIQGMRLRSLTSEQARMLGLRAPGGLMITAIKKDSPAQKAGLRPEDVILQANGKAVSDVEEFKAVIEQSREKGVVLLLVSREGQRFFRALKLKE